jgi:phytoene/squalene synthetase
LPAYFIYTPQHWQQRASEMRVLAKNVDGDEAQETMLRMAQHYDRLAAKAQEQMPKAQEQIPATQIPQAIPPAQGGSALESAWQLSSPT